MSDSVRNTVKESIEHYTDLFGISDYSYKLSFNSKKPKDTDCSGHDAFGNVLTDEETREVYIMINEALAKKYPDELDKTIIHELLHVRFNELLNLVNMLLHKYVQDKKSRDMYKNQIELLEHKIIVPLSEVLADNGKKRQ